MNLNDRGGLWKINKEMQGIFIECENIFRARTSTFQTSIDSTSLVSEMLKNCHVVSSYKLVMVLNQKYLMKSVLSFWKKCLCSLREFGLFLCQRHL